jgi:hypothetical protein
LLLLLLLLYILHEAVLYEQTYFQRCTHSRRKDSIYILGSPLDHENLTKISYYKIHGYNILHTFALLIL